MGLGRMETPSQRPHLIVAIGIWGVLDANDYYLHLRATVVPILTTDPIASLASFALRFEPDLCYLSANLLCVSWVRQSRET